MLAAMNGDLPRTLLRSSWGAIAVGLFLEGLQLAVLRGSGGAVPGGAAIFAETVQKLSWSWIVCAALACGVTASRAAPRVVGLVGLLGAPLSFGVARAVHKSVAAAVGSAVPAGGPSPWLLAGIKGVEYLVFGLLIARLAARERAPLSAFLLRGLVIGAVFGAGVLWLMNRQTPGGLPAASLAARGVNELFFPVGCACVLWSTGALARRVG
jgi:hypothetical protein